MKHRQLILLFVLFILFSFKKFGQDCTPNIFDNSLVFCQDTLPDVVIYVNDNPYDGYFLLAPLGRDALYVLDNNLNVVKSNVAPGIPANFALQPSGWLSYTQLGPSPAKQIVLDTNLNPIDTFMCVNGVDTDMHDFIMTAEGHAILLGKRWTPVDMSQVIAGGQPDAMVLEGVIQEFDARGDLVFEWYSLDHIPVTDTDTTSSGIGIDLTAVQFSYIHQNSIEIDVDGHFLLSCRFLHEILKINRQTGEVIWRMGKGSGNEFSFVNDPYNGFSAQHDARRLPNGNLSVFDNGNYHASPKTRIVEYSVDEVNKVATLVRQYELDSVHVVETMGNAQLLPNGNYLAGWGSQDSYSGAVPSFTEIRPDGSLAFSAKINEAYGNYRVYKYQFPVDAIVWPPVDSTTTVVDVPIVDNFVRVYPNPVTDILYFYLDFKPSLSGEIVVELFDSSGKPVKYLTSTTVHSLLEVRCADLPTGTYFYQVRSGEQSASGRVVIAK